MAIEVKINNVSIQYPQVGDTEWGVNATDFAIQTATAFAKVGLSTGTTVDIPGTLDVTGDVAINTNKFNVTASSGNTTIAGTLGVSDGTALAPSITPSSDTNTGFYSISADKIGFSANGVRQGEFGIGYGGFTGNIIQVVHSSQNYATSFTNTSNYNSDILSAAGTTWEVSITPRYTNSKILVTHCIDCYQAAPTQNTIYFGIAISRKIASGAYSFIFTPQDRQQQVAGSGWNSAFYGVMATNTYYDSPGTTSTCSYKFSIKVSGSSTVTVNSSNTVIGTSTATLMEVQQ